MSMSKINAKKGMIIFSYKFCSFILKTTSYKFIKLISE